MKILAFISLFSLSLASFAAPPVDPNLKVPTITPEYFHAGQTWVWKYFEDGNIFSTEKYTVLSAKPDLVIFEMSTKLKDQTEFAPHHRLEVNPERCLKAYKNSADYKPWSIKLYYLYEGKWVLVDGLDKTLAFEEKFNCNPHVFNTAYRQTLFEVLPTELGNLELFQQRKARSRDSSWFFAIPSYPGVMAYKNMSLPDQKHQYTVHFSLSE